MCSSYVSSGDGDLPWRLIRGVVFERGLPVGASQAGYYWLEDEADLLLYLRNLKRREEGIRLRSIQVNENFYKERFAEDEKVYVTT